jgi:hypothetical protein
MTEDGTLLGASRDEAMCLQGAPATAEGLATSEVGYLTYVYCLMCQPNPKDEDYRPVDVNHSIPAGMKDRDTADWLGEVPTCRAILSGVFKGQIAWLRQREAPLRKSHEDPSRAGAETRNEGLEGPLGRQLDRQAEMHDRAFLRAYNTFVSGRKETARTGRAPGVLDQDLRATLGGRVTWQTEPEPEPPPPRDSSAHRAAAAGNLAPRESNGIGIGSPTGEADDFMAATIAAQTAAGPTGPEQQRDQEQEQEQDLTSPKAMTTSSALDSDPDLAPAPDLDPDPNPNILPIHPLA